MPRTLLVLRHGHAERSAPPGGDDVDRRLRPKGQRAVLALQPIVHSLDPGLVLSSPSVRTRETVQLLELAVEVDYMEPLYGADADELIEALRELEADDDDVESEVTTVLLVGHNPGVAQLVLELTNGEQLPGFPPAALAVLDLDIDDWWGVAPGCGRLRSLHLPEDPQD